MNMFLISILPIVFILILVLLFRKSLFFSAPLTFTLTLFLSVFLWKIYPLYAAASSLKGFFIAFEITLIVFGALFFLDIMKKKGVIESIECHLSRLSSDKRVQAIALAFMFGSFLEGAAGFGTPTAIVAPLLVEIGFPALTAVIICLIANSTSVVFGAVGTPIKIGFSGLDITGINFYAGLVNLIIGTFVPLMIVVALVIMSSDKKRWQRIKEMIPFSIVSGLCFTVPYFIISIFDFELPTILGSIIGMVVLAFIIRKKLFIPEDVWVFDSRNKKLSPKYSLFGSFLPYFVVVVSLIVVKFINFRTFTYKFAEEISYSINIFNPGVIFVVVAIFFSIKSLNNIKHSFKDSFFKLEKTFIALFFIAAFVQLMANTNFNSSGFDSMISIISRFAMTSAIPFFAPFVGAFGAFIAGSATVSNIMLGKIHFQAATALAINPQKILALEVVGAAAGNMIALNNIVAAQATVKLHGQEERIIKINIIPCLIYLALAGILGLILVYIL